ncbi:CRISPR-associated endonuclease Cas2 [Chloroflexota bacterium]
MFIMVCYDITSNKRRNEVAQTLEGFGYRVQESVFECEVNTEQYRKMKQRITRQIAAGEDGVRYYSLCANCLTKIEIAGLGEVKRDEKFYVV